MRQQMAAMAKIKVRSEEALVMAVRTGNSVAANALRVDVFGAKTRGSGSARIQTYGGGFFDFLEPEKSEFSIEDIARALSKVCRFTGHVNRFYSVAQHSVLVSRVVPVKHAFIGLMHDASEAFCNDISSPLKALLPDYRAIENKVEREVLSRFGLEKPYPKSVKDADLSVLKIEQFHLMPARAGETTVLDQSSTALSENFVPLGPDDAYELFMDRYLELTGGLQ